MFSKNAETVLERRYLKKDKDGKPIEKPDDLLKRVAHAIAEADQEFDVDADIRKTQDVF